MNKKLILFTIIASSIITLLAGDIFLPSLPQIAEYFAVNNSMVQLSISFFLGGQVFATLFWGTCADNIGRKKTFALGMSLFFIGTIACLLSATIYSFLLGRLIQGMGSVVVPVVGWALIQDMYPKDESAGVMSWVGGIVSLAPMAAPFLGGQITKYVSWKGDFYFIAFTTSAVLAVICMLPKNLPTNKKIDAPKHAIRQYGEMLRNKLFISYVSLFALLACGEWCFLTILPFLFTHKMHLSEDKIGFFLSLSASFFILGALIAPRFLKQLGIVRLLSIGTTASVLSGIILLSMHFLSTYNPLFISLAFGFYLFCGALLWGSSSSRALQCYEEQRGSASAVRSLLLVSFFAVGSYLGTLIRNDTLLDISLMLIFFSISSMLLCFSITLMNRRVTLRRHSGPASPNIN